MKKDRMRELLTELRDRDFSLEDCCIVFMTIKDWVVSGIEKSDNTNPQLNDYYQRNFDHYRTELEKTLRDYELDYTLDEFITYD